MEIHVGRHVGAYLENRLLGAKSKVYVCSPWISPEYVERLLNLSKHGVSVRVLTAECENNEDSVRMIREFFSGKPSKSKSDKDQNPPDFEVLVVKNSDANCRTDYGLHAKVYVVDGIYAVTGSANLTVSGLSKNIELVIVHGESEAPQIEKAFEEIWSLYEREPNAEKLSFSAQKEAPKAPALVPAPAPSPAAASAPATAPPNPQPPHPQKEKVGISQKNLELGMSFERYVRSLLTPELEVLSWNKEDREKKQGGGSDENLFDFRVRDMLTGKEFFLECMYRNGFRDGKLFVAPQEKLDAWREASKRTGLPACIIIGVGSSPDSPSRMFCFDLRELKWPELYPSVYEKCEVDTREPITSESLVFLFEPDA